MHEMDSSKARLGLLGSKTFGSVEKSGSVLTIVDVPNAWPSPANNATVRKTLQTDREIQPRPQQTTKRSGKQQQQTHLVNLRNAPSRWSR